ncbi:MAG: hypothetical protein UT84_C0003G0045 [Candidatus Curtissbacteria bacterium GW2011_GWA1_40_16]|uniref:Uncharacterized protein n=1 Tax=Candidatus Curtissbacteria bacterium GW2011_GWA1_40_16 TaxID=1618405 RepID=A0A0G0TVE0_9BACT|nr:MAG: hypothetical protein UT84_C0003G0045 [Candidatus Curtissbacteria bacterium GW2011_GWA1_40_16]
MRTKYLKLVMPVVGAGISILLAAFIYGSSVYALESSPTPTPTPIPTPTSTPTPTPTPTPPAANGSIKVCKIIIDSKGKVTDGSEVSGITFSVSGLASPLKSGGGSGGLLPKTTFTTPLTLNSDLLDNDGKNDASCVTYSGLAMGDFFYSRETISATDGWGQPKYNDQFNVTVKNINSFFNYDEGVFKDGFSDSKNADGQIILQNGKSNRTLVLLNMIKPSVASSPTPTPSPTPAAGGTGGNNTNNNQSQSQTQNNDQTVNVTVDQSVLGAKAPAQQPETGISVLGLVSAFSAAPFGLMLSRYGKGKTIYRKKEDFGKFAVDIFGKRNRGLDNL